MKKERKEGLLVNEKLFIVLKFSAWLFLSLSVLFTFYKKASFSFLQIYEAKLISSIFGGYTKGNTVFLEEGKIVVEISKECIGFKTFALLFSLILSTPFLGPKKKAYLLLLSIPLSFMLNILRITLTLYLTLATSYEFYRIYDNVILASLNSFAVVIIWYFLCLRKISPLKPQKLKYTSH